jgi:GntR family transcriptional regulator
MNENPSLGTSGPSASGSERAAEVAPAFSPLYQQIKQRLVRSLQAGEWLPGQSIPSENELASRYRVSQGTVRKAIDELATDNLLVRRQGKGTFVATHAEQSTQYRFLRLQPDDAVEPGLQRQLLECRRMRAPAEVARLLELKTGDAAVQVRRLLLALVPGGLTPVVLDDLWLPAALFKGLTAERLAAWRGPLYRLFEAEFAVHMVRAEEKLRAVAAGPEEAGLLAVAERTPLLSVERLAFTYGDRPVELRRGLYHTAYHHYRNQLS